jgi:hypothetical protein
MMGLMMMMVVMGDDDDYDSGDRSDGGDNDGNRTPLEICIYHNDAQSGTSM